MIKRRLKRLDLRRQGPQSSPQTRHPARGTGVAGRGKSSKATGVSDLFRTIARHKPLTARVGLLAVGHHTYWPQFPGLLDEMHRKIGVVAGRLEANGVEVETFGLVDNAQSAWGALPKVKGADLSSRSRKVQLP